MASSMQQKYQVFLSFRGEDTRLNFTSHLHAALVRKGIHTFIDNRLKRGEEVSLALLKAIQESKISIIVLSKDYASSSWCLKELSKILECKKTNGQIVVPIFYHVDPSDVRNQKGSFEVAFEKHQQRFKDRTEVERWRAALKEVGNLSGYHIHGQPKDRCESEHITIIVEDISKKLIDNPSNDFKGLVGIDSRIEEIESMLVNVGILGIWGMGGIGKTTIAEVIYHRNSAGFEGCCFLQNVKKESEKGGWICLRDGLLCNILEERNLNIGTSLLPTFIQERLQYKKVFIVFDDVDDSMQLDFLRNKYCFGPGSKIILTSRDKQVLKPLVDVIYEVKGLFDDEALVLFSLYAFEQSHHQQDFMELSRKMVHYANGVPLALKVLGSALYGKNKLFWEGELKKFKEIPNPKIHNILRISFDGLDYEVKDIFLDIACFFKQMDKDYVTDILSSCYCSPGNGISVLIDKSLITISYNKLEMHALLQQMAWNIVCREFEEPGKLIEPGKRSRLWNPKDIYHVLQNNTGTGSVTGMLLDMSKSGEVHLRPEAFAMMYNLQFLKFYHSDFKWERRVHLPEQGLESLPDNLILFHWDDYPSKSLPSNFCSENLVELCMPNSHVKQLWNGVQNLGKLKRLYLNNSKQLIEIPDLSRATNLEIMCLRGCTSLVQFSSSIGYLNNLCYLGLGQCKNIFGQIQSCMYMSSYPSLNFLCLDYCSNITKFPKIPRNVENLCLSGIAIEEVPSSIGCLSRLKRLCLAGCRRIKKLPSSICKLKWLAQLRLYGCLKLESFPEILETMECLEFIDLSGTPIEELPSSIEHLVGLKRLWLNNCEKLKNLPSSIRKLNSLEDLSLRECSNITKFPEIPGNLKKLCLRIIATKQMPFDSLPRYIFESKYVIEVSGFSKLEDIQEHLGTVEEVNIHPLDGTAETGNMRSGFRWSTNLSLFSNLSLNDLGSLQNCIGNMKFLKQFSVSNSFVFEELPNNLENLQYLTKLRLCFCNLFEFSSRLTFISSLRELDLSGNNFETVPASIKQLLMLEKLDVSYCKRLQSLPELPTHLHLLDAHDCTSLEAVSVHHRNHRKFMMLSMRHHTHHRYHRKFIFTNCINLDQKAILNDIQQMAIENVKLRHKFPCLRSPFSACLPGSEISKWFSYDIQQMAIENVKLCHKFPYLQSSYFTCIPGSEIPEWFSYQNSGSFLKLPEALLPHEGKFVGFILCAVVSFENYNMDRSFTVKCQCNFKITGGRYFCNLHEWNGSGSHRVIGSDHVFLGYYFNLYRVCYIRGKNYLSEASFEFSAHDSTNNQLDSFTVEKCGVCLLYKHNDSMVFPHQPSESDAEKCNSPMIQPSPPYDPMVKDGSATKRSRDDYCYDEAKPSGNFRSDEEEEPHLKRLK